MTVAEMKISNRERLNKLETLDPEKLNDILDYVFSKLVSMPNEEEKKSKEKEKKVGQMITLVYGTICQKKQLMKSYHLEPEKNRLIYEWRIVGYMYLH